MTATSFPVRSVKAMQLTFDPSKEEGKRSNGNEIAEWCGGTFVTTTNAEGQQVPQVVVESRTGTRVANVGDYVVELSESNFTVMSERDFDEKYDTSKKK